MLTSWSSDEWRQQIRPLEHWWKRIYCAMCGRPWIVDEDDPNLCPQCQEL